MMMQLSQDGGANWKSVPTKNKHVDNHIMYIDPTNTRHFFVGCDGGLYETWDDAQNWHYKQNLSLTQFYKVATDNAFPFYNVFGGTQDNSSLGGPSRTINNHGISNADWYITNGGDGFESQVDPKDPNIIYAQSQYGGMQDNGSWLGPAYTWTNGGIRNYYWNNIGGGDGFDAMPDPDGDGWVYSMSQGGSVGRINYKTGERWNIRPPYLGKDEKNIYRFNWNAAIAQDPFDKNTIYYGSQHVHKSTNKGVSWETISPDLTTNDSAKIDQSTA